MRIFTLLALLLLWGCGGDGIPDPVAVSGQILLKGKPVGGAIVGYTAISAGLPAAYRYGQCTSDAEGRYSLPKIYPAEYMVCIVKLSPKKLPAGVAEDAVLSNPGDPAFTKYATESPLRAVVTKDATQFNFDLGT